MSSSIEPISLIGQMVKTVDKDSGVDVTPIISFMYPSFQLREEVFFDHDNDVIYIGPYVPKVKEMLSTETKRFIAVANMGIQDIDLTNRERALEIAYSKWGKTPSEDIVKATEGWSEVDFWNLFKIYWVTGRSIFEGKSANIFEIWNVLGGQRFDILKCYFKLREEYPDRAIFSCVLSFLEKASDPSNFSNLNGSLPRLLKTFDRDFGSKISKAMAGAYMMSGEEDVDKEFRTIWTLIQFGKGNVI